MLVATQLPQCITIIYSVQQHCIWLLVWLQIKLQLCVMCKTLYWSCECSCNLVLTFHTIISSDYVYVASVYSKFNCLISCWYVRMQLAIVDTESYGYSQMVFLILSSFCTSQIDIEDEAHWSEMSPSLAATSKVSSRVLMSSIDRKDHLCKLAMVHPSVIFIHITYRYS